MPIGNDTTRMTIMIRTVLLLSSWFVLTHGMSESTSETMAKPVEQDTRRLQLRGVGQSSASHLRTYDSEGVGVIFENTAPGLSSKGGKKGSYVYQDYNPAKGSKSGKKTKKQKISSHKTAKRLKKGSSSVDTSDDIDFTLYPTSAPNSTATSFPTISGMSPPTNSPTGLPVPVTTTSYEAPNSAPVATPAPAMTFQQAIKNIGQNAYEASPTSSEVLERTGGYYSTRSTPFDARTTGTTRSSGTTKQALEHSFPTIHHKVYPNAVLLQGHSSEHLETYEIEIFDETQKLLTGCLQHTYTDTLSSYNLNVVYTDGPDATDAGVIVTYMDIEVVLSVASRTKQELNVHEQSKVSTIVHECFDGPNLYQFLGAVRSAGVEINEITFQGTDFSSPVFGKGTGGGQNNSSDQGSNAKKTGLIASLCVGMVVAAAALFAHRDGRIPSVKVPEKVGALGKSIRETMSKERLQQVGANIRGAWGRSSSNSNSANSSLTSIEENPPPRRGRTLSGTFRRHPTGGVKKAALHKTGAKSSDYLKKPSTPAGDEMSTGIEGDFNVPNEYDFQATPVSAMYPGNPMYRKNPFVEDEFSMPEDYNTVNEDTSLYSRNVSTRGGRGLNTPGEYYDPSSRYHRRNSPPDAYPPSAIVAVPQQQSHYASSMLQMPVSASTRSPKDDPSCMDEWSVDSYTTRSPSAADPPYRHWGEGSKKSPRSQLDMPHFR